MRDHPKLQRALLDYFGEHAPHLIETPPATTVLQVAEVVPAGARFLIDAVAVIRA